MDDGVLVAGIGNIFFRDDGFGPAVVAALLTAVDQHPLPPDVRVIDYGIRGVHLSYDLLGGVAALVLIDAVPAGTGGHTEPGTVLTIEIGPDDLGHGDSDAHGMSPVAVLANLAPMGGSLPPTYLIGCIAADVSDGMGLSEQVTAAIQPAADAVRALLGTLTALTEAVS
ncbi:MAG: hydrogenase maturation protease [Actinomycetota bacterium]|nr:hydrogenase maturation protease [Actinomycetota bacterium]MDQ2847123.1 hydrogenase maturation protease [Actinomycetota bacterium]MDQ2955705.1 hydrogenase maturation protease [Actinomycetota bacterium]